MFSNFPHAISKLTSRTFPRWLRQKATQIRGTLLNERASTLVTVVSNIGILVGIIFSIVQFLAFQHAESVRYTIQYVERYDDERFLDARRIISTALSEHEKKIAHFNKVRMNAGSESKLRSRLAQFLVNDTNQGKGLANELDLLITFFNGVQICVEEDICDKSVAKAFLSTHANSLWTNFAPYIINRRKTVENYGLGLERFQD